eukprot:g11880.t1
MSKSASERPRVQVLVIGNGIIGLTTAQEMAKQGFEVTVVTSQREPYKEKPSAKQLESLESLSALAGGWWYPYSTGMSGVNPKSPKYLAYQKRVATWAINTLEKYLEQVQSADLIASTSTTSSPGGSGGYGSGGAAPSQEDLMSNIPITDMLDNTKALTDAGLLGEHVEEVPSLIVRSNDDDEDDGGNSVGESADMLWTKMRPDMHKFQRTDRQGAELLLFEFFRKKAAKLERLTMKSEKAMLKGGLIQKMEDRPAIVSLNKLREQRIAEKYAAREKLEEEKRLMKAGGGVDPAKVVRVSEPESSQEVKSPPPPRPAAEEAGTAPGEGAFEGGEVATSKKEKKRKSSRSLTSPELESPSDRDSTALPVLPGVDNEERQNVQKLIQYYESYLPELPASYFNADFLLSTVCDSPLYLATLEKILKKVNTRFVYGKDFRSLDDVEDFVMRSGKPVGATSDCKPPYFNVVVNCCGLQGPDLKERRDEDPTLSCAVDQQMRTKDNIDEEETAATGPGYVEKDVLAAYGAVAVYQRPGGLRINKKQKKKYPPHCSVKISAHDGIVGRKHMLSSKFPAYVIPRGDYIVVGGSCMLEGEDDDDISAYYFEKKSKWDTNPALKLHTSEQERLKKVFSDFLPAVWKSNHESGKAAAGAGAEGGENGCVVAEQEKYGPNYAGQEGDAASRSPSSSTKLEASMLKKLSSAHSKKASRSGSMDGGILKEKKDLNEPLLFKIGKRPVRDEGVLCGVDEELTKELQVLWTDNYGHGGAGWTLAWGCAHDITSQVVKRVQKM